MPGHPGEYYFHLSDIILEQTQEKKEKSENNKTKNQVSQREHNVDEKKSDFNDVVLNDETSILSIDESDNNAEKTGKEENQINSIINEVTPLWSKVLASSDSASLKENIIYLKNRLNEVVEEL